MNKSQVGSPEARGGFWRRLFGFSSPSPAPVEDGLVCHCRKVSEATIAAAVERYGLTTTDQVRATTGASGGCGTCRPEVEAIINRCCRRNREKDGEKKPTT